MNVCKLSETKTGNLVIMAFSDNFTERNNFIILPSFGINYIAPSTAQGRGDRPLDPAYERIAEVKTR
jgi:hypothetical protein